MFVAEQLKSAEIYKIRNDSIARLGGQALHGAGINIELLGINDPLTHLEEFMRGGEAMLPQIQENVITYVAEKITRPKFINKVNFIYTGNDFITEHGSFSMRNIADVGLAKARQHNISTQLLRRAELEALEVERLAAWFETAASGDFFIVESMPIGKGEEYALPRLYEKTGQQTILEHVVALHGPTLKVFQEVRNRLGGAGEPEDELSLLDKMYSVTPEPGVDFTQRYVDLYDATKTELEGGEYIFGIPQEELKNRNDDMQIIRGQSALRLIFNDALRVLAKSNWEVDDELILFCRKLRLDSIPSLGQRLNLEQARLVLDGTLQYIISVVELASNIELDQLSVAGGDSAYIAAGHYGTRAAQQGIRYQGGACPTSISEMPSAQAQAAGSELSILERGKVAITLEEKKGNGTCRSCGTKSELYGCGVYCQRCNKAWLGIFVEKGLQLSPKELSKLVLNKAAGQNPKGSEPKSSRDAKQSNEESFIHWWKRLGAEEKRRRRQKYQQQQEKAH